MSKTIGLALSVCWVSLVACGGGESTAATESTPESTASTSGADVAPAQSESTGVTAQRPSRVRGRNFSVPLPSGYEQKVSGTIADMMRSEVIEPGGVILMAERSAVAQVLPGSIVVSPTATDISSDAVDEGLCGQLAELVAGRERASVERAGMTTLPWGRVCQWELSTASDVDRRRIGTVFAANAEDWIVTCNLDTRDDAARAACLEVLNGWSFE